MGRAKLQSVSATTQLKLLVSDGKKSRSAKHKMKNKMKTITTTLFIILISLTIINCSSQAQIEFKPKEVYKSNDLIVNQISENSFVHISFIQTNDFGNVPCNGLIVTNNNEAIIFDTPTNDESSEELINWIKEKLNCKINAIIPGHFHEDCLGGLKSFHKNGIPSYANFKTIEFAKEINSAVPENGFKDSITLKVGEEKVIVKFFGEGHTRDNIVGYFPSENVMFGGCLIKAIDASKGYLGDANVKDWSKTVEKVKTEYPDVKIIVPGHGECEDKKLLDYTINLFKVQ